MKNLLESTLRVGSTVLDTTNRGQLGRVIDVSQAFADELGYRYLIAWGSKYLEMSNEELSQLATKIWTERKRLHAHDNEIFLEGSISDVTCTYTSDWWANTIYGVIE
jgi:hypothetical protein